MDIFKSNDNCRNQCQIWSADLDHVQSIKDDPFTNSTPDMKEIHNIIKKMRSNATPGPDGLSAGFYKSSWEWTGKDVLDLVTAFYQTGNLPSDINKTHITLIPKVNTLITPKDYRPISLCNVSYKVIAKTLADRIKCHLPHIIHPTQAAFI